MNCTLPKVKMNRKTGGITRCFKNFSLDCNALKKDYGNIFELFTYKLWNYNEIKLTSEDAVSIELVDTLPIQQDVDNTELYKKQGYHLVVNSNGVVIQFAQRDGLTNAISTLKQLLIKTESGYVIDFCEITDWPSIEVRSVSNTFAWYAGYGRLGFDMQLWGLEEWKEYLNICSDFKINQFNMCMYGYWPFEFDEYPETVLRNYPVKVWNEESKNWIEINYSHPNLSEEFLSKLFDYGHKLGFKFFAYIGLNSYSGGYPSIYKDKRMKLPENSKFINDFDTLCLSQQDTIKYLEAAVRRIASLGYDGIDFEESEESYWFCNCEQCKERYLEIYGTPAEAKHHANYDLLKILHKAIREVNPDIIIGVRMWREPPLEKSTEYLKQMVASIPEDIVLFWAPGLYTGEHEFENWVEAFGKERIWGRDTESNAVSSCLGRLVRIFRSNGLRCDAESNHQFIEEDIRQHMGSVKLGTKGINGYMFEWYGFFMHMFAHANYGWGSIMEPEEFYDYAVTAVFGTDLKEDILYVLKSMFTIHESQMKLFPTEFPFARNKVETRDIPVINAAIADHENIMKKLYRVKYAVDGDPKLKIYSLHFQKLIVANQRNSVIYNLALASINYDNAQSKEEKIKYLKEMALYNELNFEIVRRNYFDANPVAETGTKSCMIPYHELKRVINNELEPDHADNVPIYLGVEALGWLWL